MDKQQNQQPKKPMTQDDARRMQSAFDKSGTDQEAKSRIQSAADSRAYQEASKQQSSQQKQ